MFAREKKDKRVGQLLPELRWDFALRICQGHAQWEEPTLGPTARKGRGCHGGGICHKSPFQVSRKIGKFVSAVDWCENKSVLGQRIPLPCTALGRRNPWGWGTRGLLGCSLPATAVLSVEDNSPQCSSHQYHSIPQCSSNQHQSKRAGLAESCSKSAVAVVEDE